MKLFKLVELPRMYAVYLDVPGAVPRVVIDANELASIGRLVAEVPHDKWVLLSIGSLPTVGPKGLIPERLEVEVNGVKEVVSLFDVVEPGAIPSEPTRRSRIGKLYEGFLDKCGDWAKAGDGVSPETAKAELAKLYWAGLKASSVTPRALFVRRILVQKVVPRGRRFRQAPWIG